MMYRDVVNGARPEVQPFRTTAPCPQVGCVEHNTVSECSTPPIIKPGEGGMQNTLAQQSDAFQRDGVVWHSSTTWHTVAQPGIEKVLSYPMLVTTFSNQVE